MIVALLVCLIPTTIGGLLSAIGIAGMDRLLRKNVLAMSGRAVEAAGDVDTLLLDKTGTITLGNRMATELIPVAGVTRRGAGRRGAARQPGRRDARGALDRGAGQGAATSCAAATCSEIGAHFIPFSAQTRMSGCDLDGRADPQGRGRRRRRARASSSAARCPPGSTASSTASPTPAARRWRSSDGNRVLGIIHLKDVVKGGIAERFARFRAMGIRTVMITGDNPRTAAAIAARGRRRRLPRRGHARGEDAAHQGRSRRRASWWR